MARLVVPRTAQAPPPRSTSASPAGRCAASSAGAGDPVVVTGTSSTAPAVTVRAAGAVTVGREPTTTSNVATSLPTSFVAVAVAVHVPVDDGVPSTRAPDAVGVAARPGGSPWTSTTGGGQPLAVTATGAMGSPTATVRGATGATTGSAVTARSSSSDAVVSPLDTVTVVGADPAGPGVVPAIVRV